MGQLIINHGTVAGDGTGENLFDAFTKCNSNFSELYNQLMAAYGAVPVSVQNYPALLEGWEGKSKIGNTIPGIRGQCQISAPNGWDTATPAGTFAPAVGPTCDTVGSLPNIGTKHAFLIAVGSIGPMVAIGSSTGKRLAVNLAALTSSHNRYDGSNYATFTSPAYSTVGCAMIYLDQRPANGAMRRYLYQSPSVFESDDGTITGDLSRDWGSLPVGTGLISLPTDLGGGTYLRGLYLLAFTTFPSVDLAAAAAWMATNQTLYPGFLGLT